MNKSNALARTESQSIPVIDGELVDLDHTQRCITVAKATHDLIPPSDRRPEDWANLMAWAARGDLARLEDIHGQMAVTYSQTNNTYYNTYNITIDNSTHDHSRRTRTHTEVADRGQGDGEPNDKVIQGVLAMVAFLALLSLAGSMGK